MPTLNRLAKAALHRLGYEIRRVPYERDTQDTNTPGQDEALAAYTSKLTNLGLTKAHYGCGTHLLGEGWVNIDRSKAVANTSGVYLAVDLTSKHPFPSEYFEFAFAEDFLEHLEQSESLLFLSEAFRTLRCKGVLRLSFPGLRGVLRKHYRSSDWEGASVGGREAYTNWHHKHFYCQESLSLVARHIGFSDITFVEYNQSKHHELCNLDHRPRQKGLNIYAELTK